MTDRLRLPAASITVFAVSCLVLSACSADFAKRKTLLGPSETSASPHTTSTAKAQKAIAKWDLNGDGTLTCQEWRAQLIGVFGKLDSNRDHSLNKDEFQAITAVDPIFKTANLHVFDDDRNGAVSKDEFANRAHPLLARADKNRDCRLEPNELVSMRPKQRQMPNGRPHGVTKPL